MSNTEAKSGRLITSILVDSLRTGIKIQLLATRLDSMLTRHRHSQKNNNEKLEEWKIMLKRDRNKKGEGK